MYSFAAAAAKSLQSCLTLCDRIDGSLPGSAVPGILQARTLEWVAISILSNNTEFVTNLLMCIFIYAAFCIYLLYFPITFMNLLHNLFS